MAETLLDPVRGHSDNTIDSPMNVSVSTLVPRIYDFNASLGRVQEL